MLPALPGAPRLVVGAPSYSEGRQECPARVWYSWNWRIKVYTPHPLRLVTEIHFAIAMQRNPSPGRRVACNPLSEGTRFRQSRQSRLEHPGDSDRNLRCCWWGNSQLAQLHKMDSVAHSCKSHGLPAVLQFAPSWPAVVCFSRGIYRGEWPPKSRLCEIQTIHYLTWRSSADVCLNKSQGSYMTQTLNIMSWCMVRIAIPNAVMVKTQI